MDVQGESGRHEPKQVVTCRSCLNTTLEPVLDLGDQYLSDFRADDQKPPQYPLALLYCQSCHLVQLSHTTPSGEMYHERYGFKSGVNATIRADHQSIVREALSINPNPKSWLDIASNDGTLLSYVPGGIRTTGIDPIQKYCLEAVEHADTIINDYFHPDHFQGQFDVITSISMFYDLDDPNEFVAGVKSLLAPDGVWVVQQNYLGLTVALNALDNVCHEHLTYYTLLSLRQLLHRHGLEVFRVSTSGVNGGSFRTLIRHRQGVPEPSVWKMGCDEYRNGLHQAETYRQFGLRSLRKMRELADHVTDINARGETVAIYGASTRGGTIWQTAGLDVTDLPYAVDRNPEKVGKTIASIGVPIISETEARERHPEHMLVSIWFFRDEILRRERDYLHRGGKLIFPLPNLTVA